MTASPHPLLSARNLGRRATAGDRWLLRSIDLELDSGQCLALTGPSGSGKSLLLRSLVLLDPLDEGSVLWQGQEVQSAQIPRFRRQAVYLPQKPSLVPGTVAENLRLPFLLRSSGSAAYPSERVRTLLADLGRDGRFLEQPISQLSGGEAQITALIRALLVDPMMLLLDEPTASLDPEAAEQVERLVGEWRAQGEARACIWVSHNHAQAERMGGRRLFMEAGCLTERTTA